MSDCGLLQFTLARGIGNSAVKKAITFVEENGLSWETFSNSGDLLRQFGLRLDKAEAVRSAKKQAEALWDRLAAEGIALLAENEERYPQYLKKMMGADCPPILFALGNLGLLNRPSVSFCGSRRASEKGVGIAASCARQLADQGVTVVSGYAAGVDLAAHRAALEHGGDTVFVLAEGILRASRKKTVQELLTPSNHVYVSQFMPHAIWRAENAMRRNHVIIGLSRAMILVEAGETGGTFAAGEETLRVGCPLFVVHFAQPEPSAAANPYFIAQGGRPIGRKDGVPNISKVLDAVNQDLRSKPRALPKDDPQMKFI